MNISVLLEAAEYLERREKGNYSHLKSEWRQSNVVGKTVEASPRSIRIFSAQSSSCTTFLPFFLFEAPFGCISEHNKIVEMAKPLELVCCKSHLKCFHNMASLSLCIYIISCLTHHHQQRTNIIRRRHWPCKSIDLFWSRTPVNIGLMKIMFTSAYNYFFLLIPNNFSLFLSHSKEFYLTTEHGYASAPLSRKPSSLTGKKGNVISTTKKSIVNRYVKWSTKAAISN